MKLIDKVEKGLLAGVLIGLVLLGGTTGYKAFGYLNSLRPPSKSLSVIVQPAAQPTPPEAPPLEIAPAGVILLSAKNTATFRGIVDDGSVSQVQAQIFELSKNLSSNEPIYLVLETPGGSVPAGLSLIDSLRPLPQEIKTVTLFAASMGFQIAQHLGERIITPNGTLMSHRAQIGLQGQLPGEFEVRLAYFKRLLERLDLHDAARMGLSYNAYKTLVHDEYWVSGPDAVNDKAADTVAYVKCAEDLMDTEKVTINTMFGVVKVTFSKCPLITAPLAIEMGRMKFNTNLEREQYMQYQNALLNNKQEFVRKYILTDEYLKMQPK